MYPTRLLWSLSNTGKPSARSGVLSLSEHFLHGRSTAFRLGCEDKKLDIDLSGTYISKKEYL